MAEQNKPFEYSKEVTEAYDSIYKARADNYNVGRTFVNVGNNISVKSEYTRDDYDYYRRYESSMRSNQDNMRLCMRAYDKVGIVRNVIDLMSDFVCKGIKIVHPVGQEERFFTEWFEYVDGVNVSERFVNYLYRIGNVPVNVTYGTVPVKIEKRWSSKATDITIEEPKVERRRIPLKYSFINPLLLEVMSPELTLFTGKPIYALRVDASMLSALNRARDIYMHNQNFDELATVIPPYILDAIKSGKNLVPLDSKNLKIFFYRKDDWKLWADSMIVPIIDDLIMLDKMKLADVSALDGAISTTRLWTLGHIGDSPQNSIMPTKAGIDKLRNILANNVGGGTMDLVWGPELKFQETSSEVAKFLGKAKYEPVLANIYEGLGVPFVSDSAGKGMTNNFIQMQTFVERLEYGRSILINFWEEQFNLIRKAMGYKKKAHLAFDQVNLGDDSVYKKMLIDLWDRDAISLDSVLENFGLFSNIEKIKIGKEKDMRDKKKIPPKASPFHNPQSEEDMKKLILQGGGVAPSEIGMNLNPRKAGEKAPNEIEHERQLELAKKNNEAKIQQIKYKPRASVNGRPKGKKDSSKRKQKKAPVSSKGFMNLFLWGCDAQNVISETITPILLENLYKKPNVRSLTAEEYSSLEAAKLNIFSHLEPLSVVNRDIIWDIANRGIAVNPEIKSCIDDLLSSYAQQNERQPTASEMRQIQASGYALAYGEEEDLGDEDFDITD